MRIIILVMTACLTMSAATLYAADDKALRAERHEAQMQRQQQKNERNRANRDAQAAWREYTRELKREYQQKLRDMDTEFRLREVDLKAQRDMKIAEAEAAMQQNVSQLYMNPAQADQQQAIDKLKADIKAHVDKLFEIKKQSALEAHNELIDNEKRKNSLLDERDKLALDKAKELGLTSRPEPILATPIGGELTRQEEQWNKREQTEVERLHKSNQRQLAEFENGAKLRAWDIDNRQEDFKLEWQKKSELHALNSEQVFYNTVLQTPGPDAQARQQEMIQAMSEVSKQTRLINIKYKKIHDQNRIKRNEQRRSIMGY